MKNIENQTHCGHLKEICIRKIHKPTANFTRLFNLYLSFRENHKHPKMVCKLFWHSYAFALPFMQLSIRLLI